MRSLHAITPPGNSSRGYRTEKMVLKRKFYLVFISGFKFYKSDFKGELMNRKKAFTLIELLVVIAIIALLLSIMVPSLSMVKEKAKNLRCSTNLKTLFTAWTLYAMANDGKLCNSYTYVGPGDGPGGDDPSSWAWHPWDKDNDVAATSAGGDFPFTDEERHEGVRRGSLYTYADNVHVFSCKGEKTVYRKFRSYSIPDCFGGYWARPVALGGYGFDNYRVHTNINTITRPSRSFVFIEENDYREIIWDSFVLTRGAITGNSNVWGDSITVRHKGSSSFVFADGHTEFKKWSQETIEIMEDPFLSWGAIPITQKGIEDIEWIKDGWSR